MAVAVVWQDPITGKTGFTALSTDTLPNAVPGSEAYITDQPGRTDRNVGGAWVQSHSSGAAHVTQKASAVLGAYDSDKVTSTTSTREAIPTGAHKIWVCNESVTTLQSVRFVFGDSTITAVATGGYRVSPGITTAAGDNGPKALEVEVPTDATHWAYIAESGTPTINVVWKF